MTNEKFDNFIQKQLESIRPAYDEGAWNRLRKMLPMPWYLAFLQQYGGWLYGGLTSVALLTSLFINYRTNQENKALNDKITTFKKEEITKIETPKVFEKLRIDTVVVYKTLVVEKPVFVYSNSKNLESQNEENLELKNQGISESKNQGISESKSQGISESKNQGISESKSQGISESKSQEISESQNPESQNSEYKEPPKLDKEKVEEVAKTPDTYSELKIPTKSEESKSPKKKLKIPKITTRLGLQNDFVGFGNGIASGLTFEGFINNKLSIQTGLMAFKFMEIENNSTKDFNKATGKKFEELYKRDLPDFDRIEDIDVRLSTIQLPIALNYYIHTKSDFSFLITTGTKLNLKSDLDIKFETYYQGEERYNRFSDTSKPDLFTGLFYGMGIQYQRRRFVAQLIPNFEFKFKENQFIKPKQNLFGINTTIKYEFGK